MQGLLIFLGPSRHIAARCIRFYVPPSCYLFCQRIIFRSCYTRRIHLHSFLLWKWSTEKWSIHVSISLPKIHHSCSFLYRAVFFWPMYMKAVLSQCHFYIFEIQSFFAKNRQIGIGKFELAVFVDFFPASMFG